VEWVSHRVAVDSRVFPALRKARDETRTCKQAKKGLTRLPRFWHSGQVPPTTGWLFENWVDEVDSGEIQTRKDQIVSSVRRAFRKGRHEFNWRV